MQKEICKVVCIGGGSGLSQLVKGIKDIDYIELKCIVTVADNGGSSGVLKEELNIPAVGDIRNVLVSLANFPDDFKKLMNYRFDDGGLKGHSLGNLILAGLLQSSDDNIGQAVKRLSNIFNVRGMVIPASNEVVDIKATLINNVEIYGEKNIGMVEHRIHKIEYLSQVTASSEAVNAIRDADILVYSIGSLYTSLIPNLIIPEIKVAIEKTKAKRLYFANLMSQPGETDNYTLSEHINAINSHLEFQGIDYVIVNNQNIDDSILKKYQIKNAYPIKHDFDQIENDIKIISYNIAKIENNKIMHSPDKINKLFRNDLKCLFQEM